MSERKMHSDWRAGVVSSGGKTFYQVYRLIDKLEPNWKGNRETRGGYYESLHEAERLAEKLNQKEKRS